MSDDLASGFKDVDSATDFAAFSSCLELIEPIPFFAEIKRESFGLLGAAPGRRIMDVGCGLGTTPRRWHAPVIREMSRVLRPGGALVAFDNDWETLTVDADDPALTRAVVNAGFQVRGIAQ